MPNLDHTLKPPAQKDLEDFLNNRVKGQPEAVRVIAEKYALFQSGVRSFDEQEKKKPIGVFLFLGHSRVGKTEIGRILAQRFHGTPNAATIIDCVSYQNIGEVNKLLGASPGYIGYDDKPRLSKEKLYSVIPGHQIKRTADQVKNQKQEPREEADDEEEVGAETGFESWINQLHLIEQGLKNISRKFAELKKLGLTENELNKVKDGLKARRKAYYLHRDHILLSYEDLFLQSLENWTAFQKQQRALSKETPKKVNVEDKSEPAQKEEPILVIIFDEIEKAHFSLHEFLLHLMEEGRATLGNGDEVDLSRAFIILTSNIGSETARKAGKGVGGIGFTAGAGKADTEKKIRSELKKRFRPEFLNRLDATVVFNILSPQDFRDILELKTKDLELYLQKFLLQLKIEESAKQFILEETAKNPEGQAKSLKDCFEKYIARPTGNLLATGQLAGKKKINVLLEKGQVVFKT